MFIDAVYVLEWRIRVPAQTTRKTEVFSELQLEEKKINAELDLKKEKFGESQNLERQKLDADSRRFSTSLSLNSSLRGLFGGQPDA